MYLRALITSTQCNLLGTALEWSKYSHKRTHDDDSQLAHERTRESVGSQRAKTRRKRDGNIRTKKMISILYLL